MNGEPATAGDVPDKDAWTRFWANLCGGLLIGGFLWPLVFSMFGQTEFIWFWDTFKGASGGAIFGSLLPLFAGIAALVIGNVMTGTPRAIALFSTAAGALLLYMVLGGDGGGAGAVTGPVGHGGGAAGFVAVLMFLSCVAIAVGNRIRKRHPGAPLPRLLAGIGGCVLLASFVVPLGDGKPIIASFFEANSWKNAWAFMLMTLSVLAYGVLGTVSFRRPEDVQPFCRAASILARCILIGYPASVLLMVLVGGGGEGFGMMIMALIKMCALVYGHLFLVAVGLAAWLEEALAGAGRGAAPAGASPTLNA